MLFNKFLYHTEAHLDLCASVAHNSPTPAHSNSCLYWWQTTDRAWLMLELAGVVADTWRHTPAGKDLAKHLQRCGLHLVLYYMQPQALETRQALERYHAYTEHGQPLPATVCLDYQRQTSYSTTNQWTLRAGRFECFAALAVQALNMGWWHQVAWNVSQGMVYAPDGHQHAAASWTRWQKMAELVRAHIPGELLDYLIKKYKP